MCRPSDRAWGLSERDAEQHGGLDNDTLSDATHLLDSEVFARVTSTICLLRIDLWIKN